MLKLCFIKCFFFLKIYLNLYEHHIHAWCQKSRKRSLHLLGLESQMEEVLGIKYESSAREVLLTTEPVPQSTLVKP